MQVSIISTHHRAALALTFGALAWSAQAATVLPDFNGATFVAGAPIDNVFFPLIDGRKRTYIAHGIEDGEPFTESFILTDLVGQGRVLLGVQTSTQRDQAFEGGLLVEETFDYYAQDTDGNVWYFGEDVTNYVYDDDGNLIETNNQSAWLAGVNDALPGYAMPVNLTIGFNYYQEFAPNDDALDQGTISALGVTQVVPAGTYMGVLRVFETSEIDPDLREFKYFAPQVGLIAAEEGLDENQANPQLRFELVQVAAIPEPANWALMIGGLGVVGAAMRARRWNARPAPAGS